MTNNLPPAWRIEGRATQFAPWQFVRNVHRIDDAAKALKGVKAVYRFYSVRIRAN
jgi:hypothetical protein